MSRTGTESTAQRAMGLHAVRTADQAGPASGRAEPMTHAYDGSLNDGFCECGQPEQSLAHTSAVKRWIDPATGRVWGTPPSDALQALAHQAVQDEQAARAATLTTREALRLRTYAE